MPEDTILESLLTEEALHVACGGHRRTRKQRTSCWHGWWYIFEGRAAPLEFSKSSKRSLHLRIHTAELFSCACRVSFLLACNLTGLQQRTRWTRGSEGFEIRRSVFLLFI